MDDTPRIAATWAATTMAADSAASLINMFAAENATSGP